MASLSNASCKLSLKAFYVSLLETIPIPAQMQPEFFTERVFKEGPTKLLTACSSYGVDDEPFLGWVDAGKDTEAVGVRESGRGEASEWMGVTQFETGEDSISFGDSPINGEDL
ncbi:hypothetical protein GYMLUDRAFT_239149 [Collybiopsis luxurians FD-317 M1]|nr:hypothetical protein GYMLUDRAFT_239149 [Collybiopsis luxurians FD-317 M1]